MGHQDVIAARHVLGDQGALRAHAAKPQPPEGRTGEKGVDRQDLASIFQLDPRHPQPTEAEGGI
ncbi:MAG: hypothetical protein PVG14_11280 [Anaerolineales bacterium]